MSTIAMNEHAARGAQVHVSNPLPWKAMTAALALEAILLGLTSAWLAPSTTMSKPTRDAAPVMLTVAVPEPVAAPAPQPVDPPKPPTAPARREPTRKPDSSHVTQPAPPVREPAKTEAPPVKTVDGADSPAAPVPVPMPAPTTPPSSTAASPDERFIAKLRAAVQAAVVYPMALRGMGLSASIDVEFVYADGVVSNVHVSRPGRVATLDQAAIAAVQRAAMPAPPAALAGSPHAFKVRVMFGET
ncbi:TonB family protein [Pandoraea sputorum]|uniref:TonB family protein n=1 Tax=Pandoraea sputorum TaxID=93222 RepID=UPI0012595EAA|nr:TonB family protein [Pandoraea sputorum]VVE77073.1 TonB family protein [Pandoraea sputorum]